MNEIDHAFAVIGSMTVFWLFIRLLAGIGSMVVSELRERRLRAACDRFPTVKFDSRDD